MSYAKIVNLYADTRVLLFKEVFALEKLHGSSANVRYTNGEVGFFAGGAKHEQFVKLFDLPVLTAKFQEIGHASVVVHGEAYGGKLQGMSKTYGPTLRFAAFDVKIGDCWLQADQAADLVAKLGLEFVAYERGPATLDWLNAQRDLPSVQAVRNGMGPDHLREGIVIRPPVEVRLNNDERICAKHKRPEFAESKSPREVDPDKQTIIDDANKVADEFVVPMRLEHVLDKMRAEGKSELSIGDTGEVVKRMVDDIQVEEGSSIVWSKDVGKAIGRATASMFKDLLKNKVIHD